MKTIYKTARANLIYNKGRNILVGIAIGLTTLLVFVILTIGYGSLSLQFKAVNEIYPTWHMMYREISENNVNGLREHADIEVLGERQDIGEIKTHDATILLLYVDDMGMELNKTVPEEGVLPRSGSDIVLSQGILDELGSKAGIGDMIELYYQTYDKDGLSKEKISSFRISGLVPTSEINVQNGKYVGFVSRSFMEEMIPKEERAYRVMFRLANSNSMTTDEIEKQAKDIGTIFGVDENNMIENSEYLMANYIDPAFYTGIIGIIMIVILAGILTIYSIYYVSMIHKVQEYGKLKALGATKRQIRRIVLWEGLFIAGIAIPIGLLISSIVSKGIMILMFLSIGGNDFLSQTVIKILNEGNISLIKPWIVIITGVVSLITVYCSLLTPMKIASRISPVEALRYGGNIKSNAKTRSGYKNLTLFRLTKINLIRNKKRTVITILSLGMTGILFMIVSTILSCADPREIAREEIVADYRVSIESWHGDKMNPEREWINIQKNNPLNETFERQIKEIEGVETIHKILEMSAVLNDYFYNNDNEPWRASIRGYGIEWKNLENNQIQGKITYRELEKGNKVIVTKEFLHWFPETKVGDKIQMNLFYGDKEISKSFEVGAIGEYSYGFTAGSFFLVPSTVIENISDCNMVYTYDIAVNKEYLKEAGIKLEALTDGEELLKFNSYDDILVQWENTMELMSKVGYAFLIILACIGIMNLINTMINSIYIRRHELGMIQVVGMSESQLIRMLQMEGLIYTVGTLTVSLGIGLVSGYAVFLYAKSESMLNITRYHFPALQTFLLIIIICIIQILLTFTISRNFRKQSLIERIRFSE